MLERVLEQALRDGRYGDAARLSEKLERKLDAAELFERAGAFIEAASLYRELGQLGRAREVLMRMPLSDARYLAAARLAIELAAEARTLNHDFEMFVAPYLRVAPGTPENLRAMFVLAQLYESSSYLAHAIALYRRICEVDPYHAAGERLRYAEASASRSATTEVRMSLPDLRASHEVVHVERPIAREARVIGVGSLLCQRYELERLLGTGSSGSVFRARDLKLDEFVALKVVDTFMKGSTAEARFVREVSLARRLSHPNVVRIYDLAEHEGRHFFTMELLVGTDLRDYVAVRQLGNAARRDLLLQACAGLGYAHENRVVHRDIKFENLFVTTRGELKIADFGMAKAPGDASVTVTGSMGGTPYYMSPEQITDFRAVDHRTDIYALGVVAYELFTGQLPFHAKALTELLLLHLEAPPVPPRELCPDLPEQLERIILRALAKRREDRYQSCAELADDLRAVSL